MPREVLRGAGNFTLPNEGARIIRLSRDLSSDFGCSATVAVRSGRNLVEAGSVTQALFQKNASEPLQQPSHGGGEPRRSEPLRPHPAHLPSPGGQAPAP